MGCAAARTRGSGRCIARDLRTAHDLALMVGCMGWRRAATLLPRGGLGSGSLPPLHHMRCAAMAHLVSAKAVGVAVWIVCMARRMRARGASWCVCDRLSWEVAADGVRYRRLPTRACALVLRAVCRHVVSP